MPDFHHAPRLSMITAPSQMLDARPSLITDFRHWNRDETDTIMTQIRKEIREEPSHRVGGRAA